MALSDLQRLCPRIYVLLRLPPNVGEEEVADMRARGWDPTVARGIADYPAQGEPELAQRVVAKLEYRDRLRDLVSARYLAFELVNAFKEAVDAHGADLVAMLTGDIDTARGLTDSMPSADVWISLLTAAHRNPRGRWQPNDIFDFDALSVAIPYCDVVGAVRVSADRAGNGVSQTCRVFVRSLCNHA
jgi:hypothetical protein